MRICIVALNIVPYFLQNDRGHYGGAETQAAFLAGALVSDGQDVTLMVSDLAPGEKLPYPAVNAYRSSRGLRGLRFFYPRVPGIYRALAEADADLYYQRNAGMVTGLTALFCRRRGRVFVYGAGSDTDFSFRTARAGGFRDRSLYYMGLRLAHGIVAQNRAQEEACRQYLAKPVRVILNGVNVVETTLPHRRNVIVWVGAIRRVKQPELFLELARRIPTEDFLLIGGSTYTEKSFAHRVAESARSLPNLRLAGHLPRHEVLEHLSRASLLVNTSRVEGFPNAYLEAWSHGVPVISFNDVDGLIEREELGVVCDDIDGMEAQIRGMLTRPDAIAAIGRRAQKLLEKRFSAPVLAREYMSFFEELVDRNQRSSGRTPSKG